MVYFVALYNYLLIKELRFLGDSGTGFAHIPLVIKLRAILKRRITMPKKEMKLLIFMIIVSAVTPSANAAWIGFKLTEDSVIAPGSTVTINVLADLA